MATELHGNGSATRVAPGPSIEAIALEILRNQITPWFFPILVLYGLIGNSLCLVVLTRKRPFPPDIQGWFTAFCISEIFALITSGMDFYLVSTFNIELRTYSAVTCHIGTIIIYVGYFMVCWIQTGISVLRAYAMLNPIRKGFNITWQRSRMLFVIVLFFGAALYSIATPILIQYEQLNASSFTKTSCYETKIFVFVDYIIKDVLSFVLIFISSILVVYGLRNCMKKYKVSQYQKKTTVTLLAMNVTYFISQPLYNTYVILRAEGIIVNSQKAYELTLTILLYLTYIDISTNWMFFFLLGRRFRRFMQLSLRCPVTRSQAPHQRLQNYPMGFVKRSSEGSQDQSSMMRKNFPIDYPRASRFSDPLA